MSAICGCEIGGLGGDGTAADRGAGATDVTGSVLDDLEKVTAGHLSWALQLGAIWVDELPHGVVLVDHLKDVLGYTSCNKLGTEPRCGSCTGEEILVVFFLLLAAHAVDSGC